MENDKNFLLKTHELINSLESQLKELENLVNSSDDLVDETESSEIKNKTKNNKNNSYEIERFTLKL